MLDSDLSFSFRIRYRNKGTTTQSGTLVYGYDTTEVDFVTTTPPASNQTINSFSWDFTDLKPFESREVTIVINFTGFYLTNFGHAATVTPNDTEATIADNTISLSHEVMCCLLNTPETTFSNYFTMYPNPTRNILNIKLKQSVNVSSFTIYNMYGQIVKTIPYQNEELTKINITNLKSGQYFITIATDKTLFTNRFIKQ